MAESLQRLNPPRRLGKFHLLARRGEGGMATVYVAAVGEGSLARLAAVKLLRQGAPDHDFRTRFLDEAKVVVRLHHNNIVDVREAGEVGGQLYIAMELIEGRDLADVWDRCAEVGRAFPVPLAVHIVREVLRGLHYAHTFPGLGLVHRDVSPSNVLIDWAGAVRLADFGLATSAMKASLTVPGMVFGKVGYMAPEQATRSPLDGRADVYGCGVVLWELLTGRPLRDAETDTQQVAGWDAVPPSSLSNRVDDELDDIVMTALTRSRDERYQSAGDFMEALSIWLSEHAPDTTQERMSEFMNRLFGEARDRDHESYTAIIDDLARMEEEQQQQQQQAPPPPPAQDDTLSAAQQRRRQVTAPRGNAGVPPGGETIAPGTIIAQRYRIAQPLGRGGMGTVYLAEHITVGRKVAIKVLTHEWSEHEVVARRFKEEARAASAAGHPNIIEVFDAGELPDRRLFIVMEFLTGCSLYEELKDKGAMEVLRACRIVRDVARAVRAAHGVNIIHRDLKPDNIMLVNRGEGEVVKVLDFGISASAERTPEEQRLTIPGHALGTPEYMAPEQSKGRPPTESFDIYALGVILYETLAGEPPFVAENVVEVLTRKSTEPPPRLDMRRPGLPPPLVALVHASIEVDPARRPPSADSFLGELEPLVMALEGMQAIEATGAYGDLPASTTALALAGPSPFGPPPGYGEGLPPPPAYDAFDASLSQVKSRPSPAADSLLSTPVDFDDYNPDGSRKAWWVLAAVGLLLLGLLTAGVWWQMMREIERDEREQADGGKGTAVADGGAPKAGDGGGKAAADGGGSVTPPATGDTKASGGAAETTGASAAAGDTDGGGEESSGGEPADDDGGSKPSNPAESAKCRRMRQAAQDAFKGRDWSGVLRNTSSRTCWRGKYRGDAADMKIKALFETAQFAKCAKLGKQARSAIAKNTVKTCKTRAAMNG